MTAPSNGWLMKLIVALALGAGTTGAGWLASETIAQGKSLVRIESTVSEMSIQIKSLNRWVMRQDDTSTAESGVRGR